MSRLADGGLGGRQLAFRFVAALIVTGAAATPAQLHTAERERRAAEDATAALHDAVEAQVDLVLGNADAGFALDATRTSGDRTAGTADAVRAQIDELVSQRAIEEAAIADAGHGLRSASGRLAELSAVLGLQQAVIEPLQACLAGISAANRSLAVGDRGAAAAALDLVAEPCTRVRAGSAPPAFPHDFPDPHVVVDTAGAWWAYATNSTAGAVQLISSPDGTSWTVEGNALGALPAWARPGATWAPAVIDHHGRWLLFYTVREQASGRQCISVATAPGPGGPFRDSTTEPLVCERDEGGSIDPEPVVDSGRLHLLWKTELDTLGRAAEIRGARLDAGGTALAGPVKTLLRASQPWEGRTIEGPSMLQADGHHLLYSGGSWNSDRYAVGWARCDGVLGPCRVETAGPVLRSTGELSGPGGLSVIRTQMGPAVAYHAWRRGEVGYPNNRYLHLGAVEVVDGAVTVRP